MDFPTDIHASLQTICAQYGVRRLELFGSAARGEFEPGKSDLDFLVEFSDAGWHGAFARYMGLKLALEDLLKTSVDLVEPHAVANPYFLQVASQHRKLVYAA